MSLIKAPSFILVHQMGRVASNSVAAALCGAFPESTVERQHYLSKRSLKRLETIGRLPGADATVKKNVQHQIASAKSAGEKLRSHHDDSATVICGFREPLRWAISAMFQNLSTYCPWLTYDDTRLSEEASSVLDFFQSQFERVSSNRPPATFEEGLIDFKLRNPEIWFDEEIVEFHGLDIFKITIAAAPFVALKRGRHQFLFYRQETLSHAFPAILNEMGASALKTDTLSSLNTTIDKESGKIYRIFTERFIPTKAMSEYYHDSRYFEHFYSKYKEPERH